MTARILVFAGSARAASLNKRLARAAVPSIAAAGGEATFVDLREFPIPLYDGDLEAASGVPDQALRLRELFNAHQGLLIASPENNSSVSSLLKNTLDWISRPAGGGPGATPFRGKVAALVAASPGALGGLRGLVHLRQILNGLGVLVLAEQLAIPRAQEAFDADGALKDTGQRNSLDAISRRLVDVTAKLAAP